LEIGEFAASACKRLERLPSLKLNYTTFSSAELLIWAEVVITIQP
jgi:hypothetical protein